MKVKIILASMATLLVSGEMFGANYYRREAAGAGQESSYQGKQKPEHRGCIDGKLWIDIATNRPLHFLKDEILQSNLNATDAYGRTTLMIVAEYSKTSELLAYLLSEEAAKKQKINISAVDDGGYDVLSYALRNTHWENRATQAESIKPMIEMIKILVKNDPSLVKVAGIIDDIQLKATSKGIYTSSSTDVAHAQKEFQELLDWLIKEGYYTPPQKESPRRQGAYTSRPAAEPKNAE